MAAVVEQLKTKISGGAFTCHRCHMPLGGAQVTQIDLFNGRVVYKCSNVECDNHNKSGYRTFRALNIDVPAMNAPTELASIAAPAPPRPEEVSWSSGDDEMGLLDQAAAEISQSSGAESPAPAQAKPAQQSIHIQDDPDSEE